jgi:hypothetical protein
MYAQRLFMGIIITYHMFRLYWMEISLLVALEIKLLSSGKLVLDFVKEHISDMMIGFDKLYQHQIVKY